MQVDDNQWMFTEWMSEWQVVVNPVIAGFLGSPLLSQSFYSGKLGSKFYYYTFILSASSEFIFLFSFLNLIILINVIHPRMIKIFSSWFFGS